MSRVVVLFVLIGILGSCKKDDGGDVPAPEPPKPLTEVLKTDETKIQEYLNTHYYNYEEFQNPPENFDFKIDLSEIPAGNPESIEPLSDQVVAKTVTVAGNLENEAPVSHTYYYLSARPGAGSAPTIADSTFLKYEGLLLDGTRFDGVSDYTWQYLPFSIRGYTDGVTNFNAGGEITINTDGTYEIEDAGIGLIILPSGLGYFNSARGLIPTYAPLIFKLEVGLFVENTDYDNDGIPSLLEDVNKDGDLNNDNTDGDFTATQAGNRPVNNHEDPDDDNDGTPTREEVEFDADGNLILPFPDADNDGVPDHLDADTL